MQTFYKDKILRYIDDRIHFFRESLKIVSSTNAKSKYQLILNELNKLFDVVENG